VAKDDRGHALALREVELLLGARTGSLNVDIARPRLPLCGEALLIGTASMVSRTGPVI
jgi:hypothetical protein